MQKIVRPTKTLIIIGIILAVFGGVIHIVQNLQPSIDPQDEQILQMHREIGTINSTIDLNSEERNKLQEELDAETRRIQAEQEILQKENEVLRERKKELQTQFVDDPQFVEDFTIVSEAVTGN